MIKIITWNVNSITMRTEMLIEIIKEHQPDFILLQELKCINAQFPNNIFENLGYNNFINGQKTYNGVAILAKNHYQITDIRMEFHIDFAHEARYIEIETLANKQKLIIGSVYVPHGQVLDSEKYNYKLQFLDQLKNYLYRKQIDHKNIIIGGDYNVAPYDIDTASPYLSREIIDFSLMEKQKLREFYDLGFYDAFRLINKKQDFTWWDYRANALAKNNGMRIDYSLLSPNLTKFLTHATHDSKWRYENKPSDHIPVSIELEMN